MKNSEGTLALLKYFEKYDKSEINLYEYMLEFPFERGQKNINGGVVPIRVLSPFNIVNSLSLS